MSELASAVYEETTAAMAPPSTMVLEGEISAADMVDIGGMLDRLVQRGVRNVVIDLSEVSHFDFRGVRPLMAKATAFRLAGGDLKLAGLSPYLHAIFRSAGAHGAFDYFARVEEAALAFERAAHP